MSAPKKKIHKNDAALAALQPAHAMPRPVTPADALRYEAAVLADEWPPEVRAWLREGLRTHATTGLPLARCLHLPTSKVARKEALRDLYLGAALRAHGGTRWQAARAIRDLRWRIMQWVKRSEHRASNTFERAVYEAARHAPLPTSVLALYRALGRAVADSESDDSKPEVG